jgi:hypothetical protein
MDIHELNENNNDILDIKNLGQFCTYLPLDKLAPLSLVAL